MVHWVKLNGVYASDHFRIASGWVTSFRPRALSFILDVRSGFPRNKFQFLKTHYFTWLCDGVLLHSLYHFRCDVDVMTWVIKVSNLLLKTGLLHGKVPVLPCVLVISGFGLSFPVKLLNILTAVAGCVFGLIISKVTLLIYSCSIMFFEPVILLKHCHKWHPCTLCTDHLIFIF